jgi:hypothetical protein
MKFPWSRIRIPHGAAARVAGKVVTHDMMLEAHEMNMADAAEQVLRRSGKDLSSREIADQAVADGLIAPRSDKPWVYIAAAIRKDNRRRQSRNEAVRFASVGDGHYQLKA